MGYLDYPGLQRYHGKVQEEIDELKDDLGDVPAMYDFLKDAMGASTEEIDISDYSWNTGWFGNDNIWHLYTGSKHCVVPVSVGDKITISTKSDYGVYRALFSSYTTPVDGASVPIVSGYGREYIDIDSTETITVPEGAEYIWFGITAGTGMPQFIPKSVTIEHSSSEVTLLEILDEYSGEIDGLIYSGSVNVNDALFSSADVTAGEVIYYKTYLNEAVNVGSGYIALYNSSDVRIGVAGTLAGEEAGINEVRMGAIEIPEGFSYAKWVGTKAGTVEYVTRYMPPEYESIFYGTEKADLFKLFPSYVSGKAYYVTTKSLQDNSATGVARFIPVQPGGKITINKHLHSKAVGYAFYNLNGDTVVAQYVSINTANKEVTYEVPDGAYYLMVSFLLSTKDDFHIWYEAPTLGFTLTPDYQLNPYIRREIKQYGAYYLSGNYTHCLASRLCYFAGKKVLVYRCGYSHEGSGSTSTYGSVQVDTIESDGTLNHRMLLNAAAFGCTGDARDPFVGVSADGKYMFLLVTFMRNYSTSPKLDTSIMCIDSDFNIVDYKVIATNSNQFAYGTPLITPDGHIIFNVYVHPNYTTQLVYRSGEVFADSVSSLSFTSVTAITTSGNVKHNEACMGYYNGKLYMLIRCETTNGFVTWTDDLEGVSGWATPVDIGAKINAPMILQHYKGDYLPFVCSFYDSAHPKRFPALGYLEIDTDNNTAVIVGVGDLDPTLESAQNGYPSFISLGGENYAVSYYQEDATGTDLNTYVQTGLYYKYVDAREIIPNAVYFLN